MAKMNKEFDYKGFEFNTSVELNTYVDRRPNGVRKHTIITNDMGMGSFYLKSQVTSSEIEDTIQLHTFKAKEYAINSAYPDNRPDSPEKEILINLGFS